MIILMKIKMEEVGAEEGGIEEEVDGETEMIGEEVDGVTETIEEEETEMTEENGKIEVGAGVAEEEVREETGRTEVEEEGVTLETNGTRTKIPTEMRV